MKLATLALFVVLGSAPAVRANEALELFELPRKAFDRAESVYQQYFDEHFTFGQEFFVSVTFRKDLPRPNPDHAEYAFAIRNVRPGLVDLDSELEAHLKMTTGYPLLFHLALAAAEHTEDDSIGDYVVLRSWVLKSESCSAVRDSARKLSTVRVRPLDPPEGMYLHPSIFEFRLYTANATSEFTITDPEHPLVKWATEAKDSLVKCAAAP